MNNRMVRSCDPIVVGERVPQLPASSWREAIKLTTERYPYRDKNARTNFWHWEGRGWMISGCLVAFTRCSFEGFINSMVQCPVFSASIFETNQRCSLPNT
nr:hypothetical protein CFP56_16745 [Quercus suber]